MVYKCIQTLCKKLVAPVDSLAVRANPREVTHCLPSLVLASPCEGQHPASAHTGGQPALSLPAELFAPFSHVPPLTPLPLFSFPHFCFLSPRPWAGTPTLVGIWFRSLWVVNLQRLPWPEGADTKKGRMICGIPEIFQAKNRGDSPRTGAL